MKFNIVIIGAGEVGFNLAKSLSKEDHDITVIDIAVSYTHLTLPTILLV